MTNILTAAQGANFVRTESTDAVMLQLLPLVDTYIQNATGRDWTADSPINNTAILAAGILLVNWYDNPLNIGQGVPAAIPQLVQLEADALKYRKYQFEGLSGAGAISLPGAREGDAVVKLYSVNGSAVNVASSFESVISEDGQIAQTGGNYYDVPLVVILKSPADDVGA